MKRGQATGRAVSYSMVTDCCREVPDVCMNRGNPLEWLYLTPRAMKTLGTVFAVAGAVLIIVFVPVRYWMALLGVILLLAGLALRISL